MPQALTRRRLSGDTDGDGIKITSTSAAGQTIHTATNTAGETDWLWLFASNQDADGETRLLTLCWGGTTDPDHLITVPIPWKAGPVPIVEGLPAWTGGVVSAYSDEASDVVIRGWVVRGDST